MLKIDIHTHILPEKLPAWAEAFGYPGFVSLDHHASGCCRMLKDGKVFREIERNAWDPSTRLKDCDEHSIDVQVLSTVPVLFSYWAKPQHTYDISRYLNDHLAGVVKDNPKRFVGLGTLPMNDPLLARKELERCMVELGLRGVEIATHIQGKNLNSEDFYPIYEAAESLGAAIFIHPWDIMGRETMPDYWLPWLVGMPAENSRAICSLFFGGIFERFPKLKVAVAHGGGSFPFTLGRIQHGYQVRPDLCAVDSKKSPSELLEHLVLDTLVQDERALRYVLDLMGPERLALGSDYPFPLGEHRPGALIQSMNLDLATQEQLFYKTALRWLGLSEELFR